jgi:Right handed beta helix region
MKAIRFLQIFFLGIALVALAGLSPSRVLAATSCTFTTVDATETLDGSCWTDQTILVPNDFTLDGAGFTITAVDPAGGHFLGAVIMNGGAVANVKNLGVTASGLTDVCDDGVDRLRGILFDGATGSITNNIVTHINQGASGCQEGNGIEVRNAPFDNTGPDLFVTISGNTVSDYQKNGITANGSVAATITGNTVTGAGPIDYIAQNGIQIGFGGTANVVNNTVSGNYYTPVSYVACGILYYLADGVKASKNTLFANERDVCNFGKGGGSFNPNP